MSELLPQVWPTKYIKGISRLNGPHIDKDGKTFAPELGHPLPLEEALTKEYETDAHLTTYALKDSEGNTGATPLLKKSVLKGVRAEGADLYTTALLFDWDTPGHIPLRPPVLVDFLSKFLRAAELDERIGSWAAYYTSRHGTRLVYDLEKPVPVDDAEKYYISMLKEFKKHGILFDSIHDWTRRFRLPKVVRDGLPTHKEPIFDLQIQDKKLDITQFKKASLSSLAVVPDFQPRGNHPTQEECHALLYGKGAQGKDVMSFYHKRAKTLIKQTKFGPNIFDPKTPLCGDTGRNDFFQNMLGVLVPRLINKLEATPEQIFAILEGPLCELEVIVGKSDPAEHCWNFLQSIYEREWDLYKKRKEQEAEDVEAGQTALEKMAEGMRQWCEHPDLFDEDSAVVEAFVKGRVFANINNHFYPMNQNGWYSSLSMKDKQLVPKIRKSFLKDIIPTEREDIKGDMVSISSTEIYNNYSTVVQEVQMSPLQGVHGRIEGLDGEKPILHLPMYQRNPFLPDEYNAAVDGWLKALFQDNYATAIKWIGHALDFEAGPICALSITGPGSIGKKLLIEGLAECLVEPYVATGLDLCGGNNGALIKTPFLGVNEGLPRARNMSPSDLFKSYTAGDAIPIEEKYKPRINVINPLRIILTANDHEIINDLMEGKSISPETRKAMGERILHFDVGDEAEHYLDRLGGKSFTAREGHRWIRGDSGQKSNFIVAKHFMYLYKNRIPKNPKDRYCVMGNCTEVESFHTASMSSEYCLVNRAILELVEGNQPAYRSYYRLSKTGRIYVTMQGVLGYIREFMNERISERALQTNLKSMMKSSIPYEVGAVYMYELDLDALLGFAGPWGIKCERLKKARAVAEGALE